MTEAEVEITVTDSAIHIAQVCNGEILSYEIIMLKKELENVASKARRIQRVRIPVPIGTA